MSEENRDGYVALAIKLKEAIQEQTFPSFEDNGEFELWCGDSNVVIDCLELARAVSK